MTANIGCADNRKMSIRYYFVTLLFLAKLWNGQKPNDFLSNVQKKGKVKIIFVTNCPFLCAFMPVKKCHLRLTKGLNILHFFRFQKKRIYFKADIA